MKARIPSERPIGGDRRGRLRIPAIGAPRRIPSCSGSQSAGPPSGRSTCLRAARILGPPSRAALLALRAQRPPAPTEPITFAVAGDSLTAWDNQTFPEPDGELDPVTWTHWVIADGLELAGGYARGYATARDIADAMVPVDADVLVVMVGTNDTGVTNTDAVLTSIDDIVDTAAFGRS